MKQTLLQLTQRVLSSIEGEQINSISDTEESLTVVDIIKECYIDIVSNADYPELMTLFELNASGDNTKPVLMSIPDDVVGVDWIKYDLIRSGETNPRYSTLFYKSIADFTQMTDQLNITEAGVGSMILTTGLSDTIQFKFRNDIPPTYYTYFDDKQIVFDAYDKLVDTTLQKTKTKCYGLKESSWTSSDGFIPLLDSQQFNILLKESKAMASLELRQTENVSAEKGARRGRILANAKKERANYNHLRYYYDQYPSYGRR